MPLKLFAGLVNRGSSGQLQRVVMNLVQNASDAALHRPAARLQIVGRSADGQIELRFRDNGPGIAAGHLDRLRTSFSRPSRLAKMLG